MGKSNDRKGAFIREEMRQTGCLAIEAARRWDTAELARSLRAAAARWTNPDPSDTEMDACYAEDREDLLAVAGLIEDGLPKAAAGAARSLDTLVRDQIPEGVWNALTAPAGDLADRQARWDTNQRMGFNPAFFGPRPTR